ncbi:hypothetical protein PPYR_06347 [Photinus pyralis]|uniref:Acyltransferase n=1 Tax=Photinus pyralis TaxID=7054 RepID=A0A5N4ATF2_PHOPY|nr:2-acylglycerol O-acyltransferase 1-like [Photinus pyralis]XP_031337419.1 2-acylglycerol O-acyltransferase 1-like [Photinus pyralis]XP_031337420.1 2-acylglycerol O-acyltransferase 1-like [Photinus pyralis]XP_031337421.1 2-acylglycerol O-acyltransferase 1-like [Photinus pyralis]XP_031337422.1 2-acylglycerol O-acyltransferase 1-like [Photinus pyralis]XP_031337423.1 2-acylglycerol O-acyltransferase 1-like [Photinus pyralis]KAB0800585.1 hypothetical protein PPYR_06325 [Photinus pyralis]KAB0800
MSEQEQTSSNGRRLLELFAAVWFMSFNIWGALIGPIIIVFLIFTSSKFWIFVVAYLVWIWVLDRNTAAEGGRRCEWMRKWKLWAHFKNYFPVYLKQSVDFQLQPNKNYLFCAFPHGLLSVGVFSSFVTASEDFAQLFPKHKPYVFTFDVKFRLPIYREYLLSMGMCTGTPDSLHSVLGTRKGGNIGVLVVGRPSPENYPRNYTIVLKNQKGFVKQAIKNGCALVPVIAFGEDDIFRQIDKPKTTFFRPFQDFFQIFMGLAPSVFLKNGLLPKRKAIHVIVGPPMEVKRMSRPLQNDVNVVHREFLVNLVDLFEKHKYDYVDDPENTYLIYC